MVGKHPVPLAAVVLHDERQGDLLLQNILHRGDDAGADHALKAEGIAAGPVGHIDGVVAVELEADRGRAQDELMLAPLLRAVEIEHVVPGVVVGKREIQGYNIGAVLVREGDAAAVAAPDDLPDLIHIPDFPIASPHAASLLCHLIV